MENLYEESKKELNKIKSQLLEFDKVNKNSKNINDDLLNIIDNKNTEIGLYINKIDEDTKKIIELKKIVNKNNEDIETYKNVINEQK